MIRAGVCMKKNTKHETFRFYSEEMFISKKDLLENHLRFTYQRYLISNLEKKHKDWSKYFNS